jgi:hypothetical protein
MKLTDATTAEKLAAELLEPGADPATVDHLAERLELARSRGEIPTTRRHVQGPQRYNPIDGRYYQTQKPVNLIQLADAAEWAHRQGFAIRPDILERLPTQNSDPNPEEPPESDTGQAGGKWPWGDHETELLRHLKAAAVRYWENYDPDEPDTAPTNKTVVDWLLSRGLSENMAKAIASILRADDLPTGPRK